MITMTVTDNITSISFPKQASFYLTDNPNACRSLPVSAAFLMHILRICIHNIYCSQKPTTAEARRSQVMVCLNNVDIPIFGTLWNVGTQQGSNPCRRSMERN